MSDPTPNVPRLSASRLKAMQVCSMQFYLSEVLKLPQKVWQKTTIGSIVHSVLEALRRTKHRAHYDTVMAAGSIYASPAIARLVKTWNIREKVADDLMADVDPMVMLVLTKTNFMDEGATQTFEPEHEFLLVLPSGARIKGFLDRLAIHGDKAIISDYKSQGKRFTANELRDNIQALVYMLYVWKTFGVRAEVQFILLRHPPTTRTPDKHIQIVPAATPEQLAGLEIYLDYMYETLQTFGLAEAHSGYHKDSGFCERVCSYRFPVRYWDVTKTADGAPVRRVWIDPKADNPLDSRPEIKYDETVELLSHAGCSRYNLQ